jgi:hypothetical protein
MTDGLTRGVDSEANHHLLDGTSHCSAFILFPFLFLQEICIAPCDCVPKYAEASGFEGVVFKRYKMR